MKLNNQSVNFYWSTFSTGERQLYYTYTIYIERETIILTEQIEDSTIYINKVNKLRTPDNLINP